MRDSFIFVLLSAASVNTRAVFAGSAMLYATYKRGTRWLTAQSRSEVTVPISLAT